MICLLRPTSKPTTRKANPRRKNTRLIIPVAMSPPATPAPVVSLVVRIRTDKGTINDSAADTISNQRHALAALGALTAPTIAATQDNNRTIALAPFVPETRLTILLARTATTNPPTIPATTFPNILSLLAIYLNEPIRGAFASVRSGLMGRATRLSSPKSSRQSTHRIQPNGGAEKRRHHRSADDAGDVVAPVALPAKSSINFAFAIRNHKTIAAYSALYCAEDPIGSCSLIFKVHTPKTLKRKSQPKMNFFTSNRLNGQG